jgi:hypothetical protein
MFTTVLSKDAARALAVLGKSNLCTNAYLAGGSALALHIGHRISIDFDFFTREAFDAIALSSELKKIGTFTVDSAKNNTLLGNFMNVKFSYFLYDYPLIGTTTTYEDIAIADMKDIAAMKLVAITGRSTKKDYIDLYILAKNHYPLETIFTFYDQKYYLLNENEFTIIKSLTFFQEADLTEMPTMVTPIVWEEVKQFFLTEANRLAKKYLES